MEDLEKPYILRELGLLDHRDVGIRFKDKILYYVDWITDGISSEYIFHEKSIIDKHPTPAQFRFINLKWHIKQLQLYKWRRLPV